ncbi:dienelactone hydrolase family protein [Deinococcus aquatilis]|uniref:dienelactone hydrolase family protein n=1 Tax=Deinococcus aquatilis TaxID=519440 RepID=UPI00037FDDD5|nr:dienelactone hydrolase family protein [Deinococcus aquatilis]
MSDVDSPKLSLNLLDTSLPDYPTLYSTFVSYPAASVDGLQISGKLQVPQGVSGPLPAVVILHGSAGIDSRGVLHALDLNLAGFVTLEIDMWGARGLAGGSEGRPQAAWDNLPDAYGAYRFLADLPQVDAGRLGIMGFSWGGVVTMLSATQRYNAQYLPAGEGFAAHAAFYPACWIYNRVPGYEFGNLTGTPVKIFTGGRDRYDADADTAPRLAASLDVVDRALVTVQVYPDAEHGFNMLEAPYRYVDPFLYQGKGGEGLSAPHPQAREAARRDLVRFFRESLVP